MIEHTDDADNRWGDVTRHVKVDVSFDGSFDILIVWLTWDDHSEICYNESAKGVLKFIGLQWRELQRTCQGPS